jgi:hypothetical protein
VSVFSCTTVVRSCIPSAVLNVLYEKKNVFFFLIFPSFLFVVAHRLERPYLSLVHLR